MVRCSQPTLTAYLKLRRLHYAVLFQISQYCRGIRRRIFYDHYIPVTLLAEERPHPTCTVIMIYCKGAYTILIFSRFRSPTNSAYPVLSFKHRLTLLIGKPIETLAL